MLLVTTHLVINQVSLSSPIGPFGTMGPVGLDTI